jgi:hypothetical protein
MANDPPPAEVNDPLVALRAIRNLTRCYRNTAVLRSTPDACGAEAQVADNTATKAKATLQVRQPTIASLVPQP